MLVQVKSDYTKGGVCQRQVQYRHWGAVSNIELVKKIREKTALSFGEINKALAESDGDEARTLELLRGRGAQIAGKKSPREIKGGTISAYIHGSGKIGVILELGSETDFVAKNEEFKKLAHELAMQVASMNPKDIEELLSQPFIRDSSVTITDLINQHIARLGENIKVRNFTRLEI